MATIARPPSTATAPSTPTDQHATEACTPDDTRLPYKAAALSLTRSLYDEALKTPNPAKTLDDIADSLAEVMPEVFNTVGIAPDLAKVLLPEVTDRIWAHTVVEHARAEAGDDYGWVFDLLADSLKQGGDPAAVRADVPRVAEKIRIETTIATAVDAITTAVTGALAGLTTNPRDIAERLHEAIDDAQAEHLAQVGDMPIDQALKSEAFATATEAAVRTLELSTDRKGTAESLRCMLDMVICEAAA